MNVCHCQTTRVTTQTFSFWRLQKSNVNALSQQNETLIHPTATCCSIQCLSSESSTQLSTYFLS